MRISDWSSDVCSSDLNLAVHDFIVSEVVPADLVFEQPLSERVRTFLRLELLFLQYHDHRRDETSFGARASLHALLDLLVVRSEEHTSELQSLMRISYAVFCLKTKRAQYTATQTILNRKYQH